MLSITDGDAVREITLDRPDARNALTRQGVTALADAVTAASQPVVYLHGVGTAFCAGADLDVVADLDGDTGAAFARRGQRSMNAIADADAVVVAGVDGPARGGGVELALACDVRVCTPAASFAETGVTLGLFGAWGGTRRLRQAVGTTHAADLSLSGRTVDATDARAMGLVSRIVEDPRAVADEIAANDPDALRELQALLGQNDSQAATDEREAAAFGRLHAEPR